MKLFLSVLAVSSVALVQAGGKEHHQIKKWAMTKAMEGCFGREVMKQYMVKVKSSAAKCMGVDAPQLELPMFQSPYQAVGAIVDGAFNYGPPHGHPHSHHGGPPHGHHHGPPSRGGWMEHAMKEVFVKKMMSLFLEDDIASGEESSDDDMMDGLNGMAGRRAAMKYFRKHGGPGRRWRRDSEGEEVAEEENEEGAAEAESENGGVPSKKEQFELGERLNAKLQQAKQQMESEVGNFTCMMREHGLIDENNALNSVEALQAAMDEYPIGDEWLRDNIYHDIELCHGFAEAVPQEILNESLHGPAICKVKMYKKCLKMHKMRTCMQFDVKQQIEGNFGSSLEDLMETTQLEENELIALIQQLMAGPDRH